jgi:hypothetical protein
MVFSITFGSARLLCIVFATKILDVFTFGAVGDRNGSAKLCSADRFLATAQRALVAGSV